MLMTHVFVFVAPSLFLISKPLFGIRALYVMKYQLIYLCLVCMLVKVSRSCRLDEINVPHYDSLHSTGPFHG